MATSVITNAGLTAAANSSNTGLTVQITSFQVGTALIDPDPTMTGVTGHVYTGSSADITYDIQGNNAIVFTATLDSNVGTFEVGNVGLFLSNGTMFTITGLTQVVLQESASGSDPGTRLAVNVIVALSNIAQIIDLTVLTPTEYVLPTVANVASLPPYSTAPYPVYVCTQDPTYGNTPVLAIRDTDAWHIVPSEYAENQIWANVDDVVTNAGLTPNHASSSMLYTAILDLITTQTKSIVQFANSRPNGADASVAGTENTWTVIPMNAVLLDPDGLNSAGDVVLLSGNVKITEAGTYLIRGWSQCCANSHMTCLYNVTSSSVVAYGTAGNSYYPDDIAEGNAWDNPVWTASEVLGVLVVTSPSITIQLQHWFIHGWHTYPSWSPNEDYGQQMSPPSATGSGAGPNLIFQTITVWKLA